MNKYQVGDRVRVKNITTQEEFEEMDSNSYCSFDDCYLEDSKMAQLFGKIVTIKFVDADGSYLIKEDENGFWWDDCMFDELVSELTIRIKYFDNATKLKKITKGNWIDVYANKDMFIEEGTRAMIPLGFALELPNGWEGHLAPRSSTFKTWGIIQTNSVGVVDDTYIGDNDQWHMPVYCLQGKDSVDGQLGTIIRKGDKIGQFRIMEVMPQIEFEEVDSFGNADRGGFGTTGIK